MGVPLHIVVPEGVSRGGLIVCQEAFGVTEHPGSAVDGHMRRARRANMLVDGLRVV